MSNKNVKEILADKSVPVCKLGKLIVDNFEVPIAICQLGEKIDVRIPDKEMLKTLFDGSIKNDGKGIFVSGKEIKDPKVKAQIEKIIGSQNKNKK